MNFWQEILARPRDVYAKLSRGQRMGVLGLVAVGIVVAALAALLGGRQSFTTLSANLELADANEIVGKLAELGIPHEMSADGSVVRVPDTELADARMKLAAAGVPKSGSSGWSLFDGNQLGMTDQYFNVQLTRALAGELEKSIRTLPAIKDAKVFIYLAGPSVYAKDKSRSTASVLLTARPGVVLDDSQVASIAQLVTGVGYGLQLDDVKITDSRGQPLHPRADGKDPMSSLAGLQKQQAMERALEQKAESQLAIAYGEGRATVRVSVELDPNYREKASEKVEPDNKVSVKSSTTREPAGGGAQGAKGKSGDLVTEEQTEFREGVTRELEIMAAGQVKRMSVSVFVDQALLEPDADGKTAASATELEAAVKEAVGFVDGGAKPKPGDRKDSFKLVKAPFTKPPAAAAMPGPFAIENLLPLAGNLAEAITVVIVLLTLTRVLRGGKSKPKAAGGSMAIGGGSAAASGARRRDAREAHDEPVDELQELVLGEGQGLDSRTRLARFVTAHPEQARDVLAAWLKEEVAA